MHPWQLALFPRQAQDDVWGADPATRMSSSYAPTGKASQVDGGHRLDGRWSFSSGCDHASWVLLGGIVLDDEEKPVDYQRGRVRASYVGVKAAEDPFGQVRIAEAAALLDGTWLALERDMTELLAHARAGEKIPRPLRLRIRRDQVTGTAVSLWGHSFAGPATP